MKISDTLRIFYEEGDSFKWERISAFSDTRELLKSQTSIRFFFEFFARVGVSIIVPYDALDFDWGGGAFLVRGSRLESFCDNLDLKNDLANPMINRARINSRKVGRYLFDLLGKNGHFNLNVPFSAHMQMFASNGDFEVDFFPETVCLVAKKLSEELLEKYLETCWVIGVISGDI